MAPVTDHAVGNGLKATCLARGPTAADGRSLELGDLLNGVRLVRFAAGVFAELAVRDLARGNFWNEGNDLMQSGRNIAFSFFACGAFE